MGDHRSDDSTISPFDFTYDNYGNQTKKWLDVNGNTWNFEYNASYNRLERITKGTATPTLTAELLLRS